MALPFMDTEFEVIFLHHSPHPTPQHTHTHSLTHSILSTDHEEVRILKTSAGREEKCHRILGIFWMSPGHLEEGHLVSSSLHKASEPGRSPFALSHSAPLFFSDPPSLPPPFRLSCVSLFSVLVGDNWKTKKKQLTMMSGLHFVASEWSGNLSDLGTLPGLLAFSRKVNCTLGM